MEILPTKIGISDLIGSLCLRRRSCSCIINMGCSSQKKSKTKWPLTCIRMHGQRQRQHADQIWVCLKSGLSQVLPFFDGKFGGIYPIANIWTHPHGYCWLHPCYITFFWQTSLVSCWYLLSINLFSSQKGQHFHGVNLIKSLFLCGNSHESFVSSPPLRSSRRRQVMQIFAECLGF